MTFLQLFKLSDIGTKIVDYMKEHPYKSAAIGIGGGGLVYTIAKVIKRGRY
jgi:hypothetical protein